MSLFVIADTHLSFSARNKTMEVFSGWADYQARLKQQWEAVVAPQDTVVIPGDISWAMQLEESLPDFQFLDQLPGTKIIGKGNHDYWWNTRKKMEDFFAAHHLNTLHILFNNAYRVDGIAVCGSRGWFFDAESDADQKVLLREAGRLRASIQAAKQLGGEPVVFLHYPPRSRTQVCQEMDQVLREEGILRCYYGHLHGPAARDAVNGMQDGIDYRLISSDFLQFCPANVLESL